MASSLCILLSIIQNGKTVESSKIFEIKAEQNHIIRNLSDVFSELQGIGTVARNTLFLLLCMKTKN